MIFVTAVNYRLQLWKVELSLNSLTKMKRRRNFTHDSWPATGKNCDTRVYFIAYSEKKIYFTVLIGLHKCSIT